MDVLYAPIEENKVFEQATWNEDIDENIFEYIKKSMEYVFCRERKYSKVEIYLDET